jgi:hypothetical protein
MTSILSLMGSGQSVQTGSPVKQSPVTTNSIPVHHRSGSNRDKINQAPRTQRQVQQTLPKQPTQTRRESQLQSKKTVNLDPKPESLPPSKQKSFPVSFFHFSLPSHRIRQFLRLKQQGLLLL